MKNMYSFITFLFIYLAKCHLLRRRQSWSATTLCLWLCVIAPHPGDQSGPRSPQPFLQTAHPRSPPPSPASFPFYSARQDASFRATFLEYISQESQLLSS